jgi:hypothetical protein
LLALAGHGTGGVKRPPSPSATPRPCVRQRLASFASSRLRVRFQCIRACRVCRPAGAGNASGHGTHGSRRGLLSFGPPGLKRPGSRFGAPVEPRRGNSHHGVLRPSYPGLRYNHAVGRRPMTRAETQGHGEGGPFSHRHRVTQRHPDCPCPCLPQRLCASAREICCMDSAQMLWRNRGLCVWSVVATNRDAVGSRVGSKPRVVLVPRPTLGSGSQRRWRWQGMEPAA